MAFIIPSISREQMIEVDRLMIEEYQISLLQMMEHAGENLARLASWYTRDLRNPQITILCGNGHNGGGGLVCARFLVNWGFSVKIITVGKNSHRKPVTARHLSALEKIGADISEAASIDLVESLGYSDLVVDAIIGYGLVGSLSEEVQNIIDGINKQGSLPVIALDAPSGLDVSGDLTPTALSANATLTLALPKTGLMMSEYAATIGNLYLADIGVPIQLFTEMGLTVPHIFQSSSILIKNESGNFEPVHLFH